MINRIKIILSILCLFVLFADTTHASRSSIRKYCSAKTDQVRQPYLFIASNTGSQQSAIKRNTTIQDDKILFSKKEGQGLFHQEKVRSGDCVLVNLNEAVKVEAVDIKSEEGVSSSHASNQSTFLPAVFFVHKNGSKQYGLIDEKVLRTLTPSNRSRDTSTDEIANYATTSDLVLIYIICPPDRNSLCDLTVKQNGSWLIDADTGRKFSMKVLARSGRKGNPTGISRRTHINNDTPQGIYSVWGAVTDGGNSEWHQLARIDLDAALPPMNIHKYNINSFLLSRIIPDKALDDYWVNEWPLAYSLGRISLRIASGGFEAQRNEPVQFAFAHEGYNPTHGCINTGVHQKKLLRVLVQAGVFAKNEVFSRSGRVGAKKWHVAAKLGKVFVVLKDRD